MRNIRLDLRYDGTDFSGWQVQPGRRTVQGEIERVLETILGERVRVHGSGRTDSGVHALKQVAQFRSRTSLPVAVIERALRGLLPEDLLVLSAAEARPEFDARRDALFRVYRYRIFRGRDPLLRRLVWEVRSPLDPSLLASGSRRLLGEIDATSFADASRKGRSNRVRVDLSEWSEEGPELVYRIRANRFVHHMVRTIVGTLVEVGRGFRPADDIPAVVASGDRRRAGRTAPARGLFLADVGYAGDEASPPLEGETDEVLP
ncbi:MAG: tRNA pseudouridine(38-40) synthase TruA [Candidatus Eisenbacteria bacterium]